MIFKIQNITDNTIIEIISMNIDSENNILVFQDNELSILRIDEFKDMILGKTSRPNENAKSATYTLIRE